MLYKIEGSVNCSQWGKIGKNSYIDRFLYTDQYFNTPLAELWFGTHPNGMSKIKVGDSLDSLESYLKSIGNIDGLPYLAKILSVDSALSIQLHPPKEVAELLHLENPQYYPDDKAKPEMSIALTQVKLLCGVRDLVDLREHLNRISAFSLLGQGFKKVLNEGTLKDISRYIFNLQKLELEVFAKQILDTSLSEELNDQWSLLVIDLLNRGTQIDPGIVYLYLLEYLTLQPKEAIFIEPGIPHAYISGDMFECMQASDNVVRGGLTSKYIDSSTFIDLFMDSPYDPRMLPVGGKNGVKEYRPKDCSFVVRYICSSSSVSLDLPAQSILINLKGDGVIKFLNSKVDYESATSYFLPEACSSLEFVPVTSLETLIISPN